MSEQIVKQGYSSLEQLGSIIKEGAYSRVLLFTGDASFEQSPAKPIIEKIFSSISFTRLSGYHMYPTFKDVVEGIKGFHSFRPDLIVAIGGGTIIDMAKMVNACVNKEDLPSIIRGEKPLEGVALPFVAIPTTSGTGSEATQFAVVYLDNQKYSLLHKDMLPNYVILDPSLTDTLNPFVTASTGMDALCQSIESFWSVNSTNESILYSKKGIELSLKYLHDAVNNPSKESREGMQFAAYYSGKAINIAKTTAAHALSYHLTSTYNIPHGQAVALLIGWVFKQNSLVTEENCNDSRGVEFVKRQLNTITELLKVDDITKVESFFDNLIKDLHLTSEAFELNNETKKELFSKVNISRLKNNPVSLI